MNILFASSEVVPFAKTGGLADVCESLPRELARLGHQPIVFVPAYRQARRSGQPIAPTDVTFQVLVGSKLVTGRLLRSHLPKSEVPVYLVEQDAYFDRPELYGEGGSDYIDNCERFVFFCQAIMRSLPSLDFPVDIMHCNDWQTGLLPAYLRTMYADDARYQPIATLMAIHNLAYQGQFWHWDMLLTGLDWKYFNWRQMEFHGHLNLLKTGITFADAVSTVSPRYAEEIQSEPLGCGLEGVLRHRRDTLFGILNGVDYDVWNPAHDPLLPATYNKTSWQQGKSQCKAALQREMGLPVNQRVPVVGLIGRLADQKGWDLVAKVIQKWVHQQDVQWVILGTGEPRYRNLLADLTRHHPDKVAARLEFSDRMAHWIEAGADLFLMASRYEPCGLNQMYSLKYGTVPIVHSTGGLADTITGANDESLAAGTANGFAFAAYNATALEATLLAACNVFRQQPEQWSHLVQTGMNQDWSWNQSGRRYVEVYTRLLDRHRAGKPA